MQLIYDYKIFFILAAVFAIVLFFAGQLIYIKFNGTPVAVPDIPREPLSFGNGSSLKYVVLGDSTAVGQGGDYELGIAVSSAKKIAKEGHEVEMYNFAISGARTTDVLQSQLPQALELKPDIVLIAVGANDVTRLTRLDDIKHNLEQTVTRLRAENESVKIILTGSPQMGSVPRFPQPIRYAARLRTEQVNDAVKELVKGRNIHLAPIAEQTGPVFDENPDLFASDKFHPNTNGYALWVPVINEAIDSSIN